MGGAVDADGAGGGAPPVRAPSGRFTAAEAAGDEEGAPSNWTKLRQGSAWAKTKMMAAVQDSWLRAHALHVPPPPISEEQRREIAEMFKALDADASGARARPPPAPPLRPPFARPPDAAVGPPCPPCLPAAPARRRA